MGRRSPRETLMPKSLFPLAVPIEERTSIEQLFPRLPHRHPKADKALEYLHRLPITEGPNQGKPFVTSPSLGRIGRGDPMGSLLSRSTRCSDLPRSVPCTWDARTARQPIMVMILLIKILMEPEQRGLTLTLRR